MLRSSRRHELPVATNQEQRSSNAKLRTRKVLPLVVLALAVVTFVSDSASGHGRLLSAVRKLCKTTFAYGDWEAYPVGYWENLFADEKTYALSQHPFPAFDPENIAYVLNLNSCPSDKSYQPGVSTPDTKRAFYDAASMLKFSTCDMTSKPSSKYDSTMYAVVHPEAIRCTGPDGKTYDRVQVLNSLGYKVLIQGHPVYKHHISSDYVKSNVDKDVGIRDLNKLVAYSFEHHPAAVMVDFSTLMLQNIDDKISYFIHSDKKAMYSVDEPDSGEGPNTSFLMVKPSKAELAKILNTYKTTPYDAEKGWGGKGVKYAGDMGTKGILGYYYDNVETEGADVKHRCGYGNDARGVCRYVSEEHIKVAKLSSDGCGSPWECPDKDTWDELTRSMCESFHKSWFTLRGEYENAFWTNGVPTKASKTVYKPDVFLGYCSAAGSDGYTKMIYDKNAATTTTATESQQLEQMKSAEKYYVAPTTEETVAVKEAYVAPTTTLEAEKQESLIKLAEPTTTMEKTEAVQREYTLAEPTTTTEKTTTLSKVA